MVNLKSLTDWSQLKKWFVKPKFWYGVIIFVLAAWTIVVCLTINIMRWNVTLGVLGVLAVIFFAPLVRFSAVLGIVTSLLFLSTFFVLTPTNGFVLVDNGRDISLCNSETIFFRVPYMEKTFYISDVAFKTTMNLSLDEGKEVRWGVVSRLNLVADYDTTFNLIKRFGNKEEWLRALEQIFQEAVAKYAAKLNPQDKLPATFSFSFSQEQKDRLLELGYEPAKDIVCSNIRIVRDFG